MKAREFPMQFFGSFSIRRMCFFARFMATETICFLTQHDSRGKGTWAIRATRYAFFTSSVVFAYSLVAFILRICSRSKIAPATVIWFFIFVIYFVRWPLTSYDQPRKLVRHIRNVVDDYLAMPFTILRTCAFAYLPIASAFRNVGSMLPSQNTCLLIVRQNGTYKEGLWTLADFARTWLGAGSHSTLLRSFRSEAGLSVGSALLPCFYATRGA